MRSLVSIVASSKMQLNLKDYLMDWRFQEKQQAHNILDLIVFKNAKTIGSVNNTLHRNRVLRQATAALDRTVGIVVEYRHRQRKLLIFFFFHEAAHEPELLAVHTVLKFSKYFLKSCDTYGLETIDLHVRTEAGINVVL